MIVVLVPILLESSAVDGYMVEIMLKQGILAPINHDNIPNLKGVSKTLQDPPFDPGSEPTENGRLELGRQREPLRRLTRWQTLITTSHTPQPCSRHATAPRCAL